jgi:hypothetical protein
VSDPPLKATFASEDYRLRIEYLTGHLTRMWTRFQVFVTLESALVAVLLVEGKLSDAAPYIAIVQAVLSFIWFLVGRHDRHLVRIYKHQIEEAAKRLKAEELVENGYLAVGEIPQSNTAVESEVTGLGRVFEGRTAADIPQLPAVVPGILLLTWLVLVYVLFDSPLI